MCCSFPLFWLSVCILTFVSQIVGNGSEQQLQRELEDVLMDPSVADTGLGPQTGMEGLGGQDQGFLAMSPVPPGSEALSTSPPKVEMVLPVQTAQESELNERSYRGEQYLSALKHFINTVLVFVIGPRLPYCFTFYFFLLFIELLYSSCCKTFMKRFDLNHFNL